MVSKSHPVIRLTDGLVIPLHGTGTGAPWTVWSCALPHSRHSSHENRVKELSKLLPTGTFVASKNGVTKC
jgi:hypothetical protein